MPRPPDLSLSKGPGKTMRTGSLGIVSSGACPHILLPQFASGTFRAIFDRPPDSFRKISFGHTSTRIKLPSGGFPCPPEAERRRTRGPLACHERALSSSKGESNGGGEGS